MPLADELLISVSVYFGFFMKINKLQNMMYHCSQLATAIRGEQWLDA